MKLNRLKIEWDADESESPALVELVINDTVEKSFFEILGVEMLSGARTVLPNKQILYRITVAAEKARKIRMALLNEVFIIENN